VTGLSRLDWTLCLLAAVIVLVCLWAVVVVLSVMA
jgi:hypothetical protein